MAVSANSYFSNAIQGIPQIGVDVDVFQIHTTPRYELGHRITRQDGNEFVYCHFGAATNRGLLVASDISESGLTSDANHVIAPASAVARPEDKALVGAIGSRFLQVTLASVTADMFAGGYLITAKDTGIGYTYRIRGNTATDNPATGDILIELYEKLQVGLDTTTDIVIAPAKYGNLEVATSGTDNYVVGVTCSTMALGEYGWICTKGLVGGLVDGTILIGESVSLSTAVSGAFAVSGGTTTAALNYKTTRILGQCVLPAGASAQMGAFEINIS